MSLLLLYRVLLLLVVICCEHCCFSYSEYPYAWSKGRISLTCLFNKESSGWLQIGLSCYQIESTLTEFNYTNSVCRRLNNSYPARLDNYLIVRELTGQLQATGLLWTGYMVSSDITHLVSTSLGGEFSMYNPSWAAVQPVVDGANLCVALNIQPADSLGWSLRNCSDRLPVLCQTFACRENQWRCADNSQCIPSSARRDGFRDCDDGSDEDQASANLADFIESPGEQRLRQYKSKPLILAAKQGSIHVSFGGVGQPTRSWMIENPQRQGVGLTISGRIPHASSIRVASCGDSLLSLDASSILPLFTAFSAACITITARATQPSEQAVLIEYFKGCTAQLPSHFGAISLSGPFQATLASSEKYLPFQPTYLTSTLLTFALSIDTGAARPVTIMLDELQLDRSSVLTISGGDVSVTFNSKSTQKIAHFPATALSLFLSSGTGNFSLAARFSIDCPELHADPSLKFSGEVSSRFGSVVSGSCEGARLLAGPSTSECLFGGAWSTSLGVCRESATFCPLPVVQNGFPVEYHQNGTLKVQCRARFANNGLSVFVSKCDGQTWTPKPACLQVLCQSPEQQYKGSSLKNDSASNWRAFDIAEYAMLQQFSPFRQCSINGTWDDFNFKHSSRMDCAQLYVPFGFLPQTRNNTMATPNCTTGFVPNGHVLCNSYGFFENVPSNLCISQTYSPDRCGPNGVLKTYPGGYSCDCDLLFEFSNGICQRIQICEKSWNICNAQNLTCIPLNETSYRCDCPVGSEEREDHVCIALSCPAFDLSVEGLYLIPEHTRPAKVNQTITVYSALRNGGAEVVFFESKYVCDPATVSWVFVSGKRSAADIETCSFSHPNVTLNKERFAPFEIPVVTCNGNSSVLSQDRTPMCGLHANWYGRFDCSAGSTRVKKNAQTLHCAISEDDAAVVLLGGRVKPGELGSFSCKYPGHVLSDSSPNKCVVTEQSSCILDHSSDVVLDAGEPLTLFCAFKRECRERMRWSFDGVPQNSSFSSQRDYAQLVLHIGRVELRHSGTFSCVSSDAEQHNVKVTVTDQAIAHAKSQPIYKPLRNILADASHQPYDNNWRLLSNGTFQKIDAAFASVITFGPYKSAAHSLVLDLELQTTGSVQVLLQEMHVETEILRIANSGRFSQALHSDEFSLKLAASGSATVSRLDLQQILCPTAKFGAVTFPETSATNSPQLIRGKCADGFTEFSPSFAECLADGAWNFSKTLSSCHCDAMTQAIHGKCYARGPKCFYSNSTLTHQCSHDELCYLESDKNAILKQGCIKSRHCSSTSAGFCRASSVCRLCCASDHCNAQVSAAAAAAFLKRVPTCADQVRLSVQCPGAVHALTQNGVALPVAVEPPLVHDNSPDIVVTTAPALLDSSLVPSAPQQRLTWRIAKHGGDDAVTCTVPVTRNEMRASSCPTLVSLSRTAAWQTLALPDVGAPAPENGTLVETRRAYFLRVPDASCSFFVHFEDDLICDRVPANFDCRKERNATLCTPAECRGIWNKEPRDMECNATNAWPTIIPKCQEVRPAEFRSVFAFTLANVDSSLCVSVIADQLKQQMTIAAARFCQPASLSIARTRFADDELTVAFDWTSSSVTEDCGGFFHRFLQTFDPSVALQCEVAAKTVRTAVRPCAEGSYFDGAQWCVECAAGSFVSAAGCSECPRGFYSTTRGSTTCDRCPARTSTPQAGADDVAQCAELCPAGFYSSTGLAPCTACAKGTYQEREASTTCTACPYSAAHTRYTASDAAHSCVAACPEGQVGPGGLEPCVRCPRGTFWRRAECVPCAAGRTTARDGALDESECVSASCLEIGCRNDGECLRSGDCACRHGFYGVDCSLSLNLCNASYCLNDGACSFDGEKNSCECQAGFYGEHCQHRKLTLSKPFSADNLLMTGEDDNFDCYCYKGHGSCSIDNLRCTCEAAFHGDYCEYIKEITDCSPNFTNVVDVSSTFRPNTALYSVTARKFGSAFFPSVTTQFFSSDASLSPSEERVCILKANSVLEFAEPLLICGHSEEYDNATKRCVAYDPCREASVCGLGECEAVNGTAFCQCIAGFFGETCGASLPPCDLETNPRSKCQNGGTCYANGFASDCSCEGTLFTGAQCEIPGDFCADQCDPVGTERCSSLLNARKFFCQCRPGFLGDRCDRKMDCDPELCNGVCAEYACVCEPGWTGSFCETPLGRCSGDRCLNGGTCLNIYGADDFVCNCPGSWGGPRCDSQIKYCDLFPCLHDGKCQDDVINGYICECPFPWDGVACERIGCGTKCNHGTCGTDNATAWCSCDPMWSGQWCDTDYSQACGFGFQCLNGGTCSNATSTRGNDTVIEGHCTCTSDFSGLNCEFSQSSSLSFNLAFNGEQSSLPIVTIARPLTLLREFTLCGWVRYSFNTTHSEKPPFMSLVDQDSDTEILSVTSDWVWLNNSQVLRIELTPFTWRHVCVCSPANITNTDSNFWTAYEDGELVARQNFTKVATTTPAGEEQKTFYIELARPSRNYARRFVGDVGYVTFYPVVLTEQQIRSLAFNCTTTQTPAVFWPQNFTRVADTNPGVTKTYPSICATPQRDCREDDPSCSGDFKDKIAPVVVFCPREIDVLAKTRLTNVTWETHFADNIGVIQVDSNFRSGQFFSWGLYSVIVTAYDAAGNSADCVFQLSVRATECAPVADPANGRASPQAVNGTDTTLIATVHCNAQYYPQFHPLFYTCDALGQWDREFFLWPGEEFRPPPCGQTAPSNQYLNGTLYKSEDCEQTRHNLVRAVNATLALYCTDEAECSFSINNPCNGDRSKRQVAVSSNVFQFNVTVKNSWEYIPAPLRLSIVNETEPDGLDMKEDIDCDESHPITYVDSANGKVSCVACPRYYVANDDKTGCQCQCNGTFYNDGTECKSCPQGMVVYGCSDSGRGIDDCDKNCSAGEYLVAAGVCAKCELGTYSAGGVRKCKECPAGKTTLHTGSTSESDCKECGAGEELRGENCQNCSIGTYKDNSDLAMSCEPCPNDGNGGAFTTPSEGSTSKASCTLLAACPKDKRPKSNATVIHVDPDQHPDDYCTPCEFGTTTVDCAALHCCKCTSLADCSNVQCKPHDLLEEWRCAADQECDDATYTCIDKSSQQTKPSHVSSRWWIGVLVGVGTVCLAAVALFALVMYRNRLSELMCCGKARNKEVMVSHEYQRREPNIQTPRVVINTAPLQKNEREDEVVVVAAQPRFKPRRQISAISPLHISSDLNPTPYVDYAEQAARTPTLLPNRPPSTAMPHRNKHPVELSRLPPPIQTKRETLHRRAPPTPLRRDSFHDSVSSNQDSFGDVDDSDDENGYFG